MFEDYLRMKEKKVFASVIPRSKLTKNKYIPPIDVNRDTTYFITAIVSD